MLFNPDWPVLLACGAIGAFVKDTLKDNKIAIPHIKEGQLYLGCIGGMILGAIAGYIVDNDPMTAFLGGYAGSQILQSLVSSKVSPSVVDGIK
ncbi:MAG: hypothetical protein WCX48_08775 [Bacteroidales bacterium]|jgi:hypothetical protein